MQKQRSILGQSLVFAGFLAACGSSGTSTPGSGDGTSAMPAASSSEAPAADNNADDNVILPPATGPGVGSIEVRLVDAPNNDVNEIVVTITKVTAHVAGAGGWLELGHTRGTIDLLRLQAGTFAQLGVAQMPAGRITQLRLYVDENGPNYVTTPDGAHHPLTVPSGPESGIKLKGGFDWPACGNGNVTIDFDGKKSIFVHPKGAGAGDEWLLRPVVRLKSVEVKGDGCVDASPPTDNPPATDTPPTTGSDAGTTPPPAQDAGSSDPGTPPVMTPPPGDPCATVTCSGMQFCYNGECREPIQ